MKFINRLVVLLLGSPAHRVLSGALVVVRYRGRRTGVTHRTPTQYARSGDEIVILAGHAATKTWWRNFVGGYDLDLLLRGRWTPMTGRVVRGADEPEAAAPLLDAYLTRFPKAAKVLGSTPDERRDAAVLVVCRPR